MINGIAIFLSWFVVWPRLERDRHRNIGRNHTQLEGMVNGGTLAPNVNMGWRRSGRRRHNHAKL
jgi:hypothetical protein